MKSKNIFLAAILIFSNYCFSQIPILNSNPSITNKVIYLDFDGHVCSGTLWNSGNTVNALPSTVSNANKVIIWKRMCEDYRPFDVNITTDSVRFNNAQANRRIRIVFTPTSAWYGSAGGVAYVGSFNWGGYPGTPCWVFENQLGYSAKNMAEAASHEGGHTFTLRHQSTYNNLCTKTAEYNPGIGTGVTSWAPIMGVGYSKNVTIWHLGTNSTTCTTIQADHGNGSPGITSNGYLSFLPDDVGDFYSTAKNLNLNTTALQDSGIITTPADLDAYKFTICNNRYVSIAIKPWALDTTNFDGANLDVRFMLYNAATNSLIAVDTSLTTLKTLRGLNLTPGTYYFTVDGGRSANYTDYGSLGKYFISIKATNPPAMANTILTNSAICSGQLATLNYTSNGIPNSWQWTIAGPSTFSSTLQNPFFVFSTAGIYTISLLATGPSSASCPTTETLNVGALPTVTVTGLNGPLCYNTNVTLNASGATNYQWLPGNFSGATQILSPTTTTSYTITGSNGSCSNSIVTSVTVSPDFTVSLAVSSTSVCSGKNLTITANGASSYTFNPGGIFSNPAVFSPTYSTNYIVTGNVGSCLKSVSKIITVIPGFTVNLATSNTIICAGESVTLSATGANNYTFNPIGTSGNSIIVSPTVSTFYTVVGETSQCENLSDAISVSVSECTFIKNNSISGNDGVEVFPNPAADRINVKADFEITSIEVLSALGSVVFSVRNIEATIFQVSTDSWSKGIYFVRINSDTKRQLLQKVVVE